jgi:hypothetical protein
VVLNIASTAAVSVPSLAEVVGSSVEGEGEGLGEVEVGSII